MSDTGDLLAERYVLGRILGRGGFATMYLATDQRLGRQVAVKLLDPALAADPASAPASTARPAPSPPSTTRISSPSTTTARTAPAPTWSGPPSRAGRCASASPVAARSTRRRPPPGSGRPPPRSTTPMRAASSTAT